MPVSGLQLLAELAQSRSAARFIFLGKQQRRAAAEHGKQVQEGQIKGQRRVIE